VSDAVTLARTARESLARGLTALQGDPNVPPQLLEVAAPIAQAMGALHQIERTGGAQIAPGAQNALAQVQAALGQLQSIPTQHPAVVAAMEAVAGALGSVHALTRAAPAQPAAPPPQAAPVYAQQAAPPPQPAPAYQQPPAQAPQAAAYAQTAYAQTAYAAGPPQAYAPPPQQAYAPPPQAAPPQYQQPAYQQPPAQPAAPARPAAAAAPTGAPVSAELGAHSTSNFYKGLSGNDIIDHGGLFVSTYKLPKIGAPVRLKVSMPGGYEFEANAIVRWCREASEAGNDAPPGFGAQFVDITPEARQLVYRYVRNREPMFHDDL
jgi:hypothetical protein